jgi:hypothetical protein
LKSLHDDKSNAYAYRGMVTARRLDDVRALSGETNCGSSERNQAGDAATTDATGYAAGGATKRPTKLDQRVTELTGWIAATTSGR